MLAVPLQSEVNCSAYREEKYKTDRTAHCVAVPVCFAYRYSGKKRTGMLIAERFPDQVYFDSSCVSASSCHDDLVTEAFR